ncbi:hypothetical protein NFI96_020541, partial [Prochilodus magdalenae]
VTMVTEHVFKNIHLSSRRNITTHEPNNTKAAGRALYNAEKHSDMHAEWSGSPSDAPELRLILVGNIGCGKTMTADTLLGQSSPTGLLRPSRQCEVRRGVSEGRRLTVVETPRWYWSGQNLESSVQRETERALSLVAPGPHAFLILVPVGEFTEMEQQVPAQLEGVFGTGVLGHSLVLLTCGDYLLGRDEEQYMKQEEPHLKAMVDSCGGHWHVINNRRPQERQQVVSLLEKVEQLAQSNGGCYLQSALQREMETRIREKELEFHRRYRRYRVEPAQSALAQTPQNGGHGILRSQSREETDENVTPQQLVNGLHSQPSSRQDETATGHFQRSSSFKLTKEGAILSQMSEQKAEASVSQNNQSFINTIHHHIASPGSPSSSSSPSSTPFTISSSSTVPASSSSSSSSVSDSSASGLRLVLLGQTGSGKSSAGNAILGREEFVLHKKGPADHTTQRFTRGTAVVGHKQVAVVDTPDWFWSNCSPADLKAHQLSCAALCNPGPHAFLLCVPVTLPAHTILHGLAAIEEAFGPEAIPKRTLVLFTFSDLLGGEGVEEYIAKKRPEMLELVEKCGDRYHVLVQAKEEGKPRGNTEELLEKVEQLVKETGGSCYSLQEDVARERAKPHMNGRGEKEQLDEVDRAISTTLHSLKEEDEDEEEVNQGAKPQEPATSSSSRLGSILRFVGGKVGAGAKRVPKLVAGGALLGGAVGLFFGGPLGGAVGATAGSVAAEVGRRKYGKSKTE